MSFYAKVSNQSSLSDSESSHRLLFPCVPMCCHHRLAMVDDRLEETMGSSNRLSGLANNEADQTGWILGRSVSSHNNMVILTVAIDEA